MKEKLYYTFLALLTISYVLVIFFDDAIAAEVNLRYRQQLHRSLTPEQITRVVTNTPVTATIQLPRATAQKWAKGIQYQVADRVLYEGKLYLCLQTHTVHDANWTPPAVPALWRLIKQPTIAGQLPDWVQPLGGHDAYKKGDKVRYDGKDWESMIDNNVWVPGIYGWKEILP